MTNLIVYIISQAEGGQGAIWTLVDLFRKGGGMMWLLLAVAVLSLAIIIERLYTLFKIRTNPKKFVERLINTIEDSGIDEGIALCSSHASSVAKICLAGLEKAGKSREIIEEAIAEKSASELAFLDRGMIYLGSFATIAPILGFLGTVTGMIKAFNAVAQMGEVEPTYVAAGISEALITTATGLLIAAPVALAHAFFSSRVNAYTRDMEESANMLLEYLLEKQRV